MRSGPTATDAGIPLIDIAPPFGTSADDAVGCGGVAPSKRTCATATDDRIAESTTKRHVVLVHGAWQGSWAFAAWTPLLEALGWQTHAVDLPGNGWPLDADANANANANADTDTDTRANADANLASYAAHVTDVVRALDTPVILVGHSGGGLTVSQVAEAVPERIAGLVYLAGMMLPSGLSYAALVRTMKAESPGADLDGISPWLTFTTDGAGRTCSSVRTEGALRCFLHDCEPTAARDAAALLRPQQESGRAMTNTLTASRFGRVPRLYVECRDDRSVMPAIQRRMQALTPGAECLLLDCGHVPQLAQPHALTELLVPRMELLLAAVRTSFSINSPPGAPMTDSTAPPSRPTHEQMLLHLRRSNEVARRAIGLGHHPFGALLVGPDHETVLLEQCNIDTVNHAESTLARVAATNFTPEFLWQCTLYTAVEPCCMCAGTAYWANIGRVVFGMTEAQLLHETGRHAENPTMSVSSRYVFDHCQKPVDLVGPVAEVADETIAMQRAFWSTR